jgi:hypothetical protein
MGLVERAALASEGPCQTYENCDPWSDIIISLDLIHSSKLPAKPAFALKHFTKLYNSAVTIMYWII